MFLSFSFFELIKSGEQKACSFQFLLEKDFLPPPDRKKRITIRPVDGFLPPPLAFGLT